jgi:DNA-directed RNA polymerase delta subunit
MISLETVIQRNETQFIHSSLGEELMMLNTETGDYFNLNVSATKIWEMAEEPIRISEIVTELQDIYTVSEEECLTETQLCISKMIEQGVLTQH